MKYLGKFRTSDSAQIKDSMVSVGFECLDRELFDPDKCYDLLGQSGVKYARCQTGWARCEKETGVYDFTWLDDIVDNLIRRGVLPWFNVGFGNPVYMPDVPNPTAVGCVPILYGKRTYSAWKSYLRALAEHYRDRIRCFEIWNEPDIRQFWYPSEPDAAVYAQLVSDASAIIKAVIPNAKIGASVSRINFLYTETFARNLRHGALDFYCYHAYSMVPEENYIQNVRFLTNLFETYGHNGIELWQGEAGYPSWFPKNHWLHPHGDGSEHQQAVWQLRRYFLDAAAGVKISSFFQMADMWEKPYAKAVEVISKPAAQGILNGITYTPKLSYHTLSRLAAFFSGTVSPLDCYFAGRMEKEPVIGLSKLCIPLLIRSEPIFAYYLPTDIEAEVPMRNGAFTAMISYIGLKKHIDSPVLIDLLDGSVYDISDHIAMNDCSMLVLNDLPIAEYPLVICNADAFAFEESEESKCRTFS